MNTFQADFVRGLQPNWSVIIEDVPHIGGNVHSHLERLWSIYLGCDVSSLGYFVVNVYPMKH